MPKKNRATQQRKKKTKNKKNGLPFAGLAGRIIPGLDSIAEKLANKLGPVLAEAIPFPTSGTTMSITPPSLLAQYDRSLRVTAPAANGTYFVNRKAKMRSTGTGMRVIHREYFADLNLPTSEFNVAVDEPINPGNRALFPWLSGIATRFEAYRFNNLSVIYEPGSSTDNDGWVMAAIDFDVVDAPPSSKIQMLSYDGARACQPWSALAYNCMPYNMHKLPQYYVAEQPVAPKGTDAKTYFVGNLFLATQNASDPFVGGSLFVQYDIDLITPQLNSFSGNQSWIGSWIEAAGNTPYLPITTILEGGNLAISIDGLTDNFTMTNSVFDGGLHEVLIPAPGAYLITISCVNTGQNPNVTINTTDPPPFGVFQPSIFVLDDTQAGGNVATYTAVLVSTNGPVWFKLSFAGDVASEAFSANIAVTPLDDASLEASKPFLSPALPSSLSAIGRVRRGLPLRYEQEPPTVYEKLLPRKTGAPDTTRLESLVSRLKVSSSLEEVDE